MPRYARKQSDSSTYHIMLRGINREKIFLDEKDKYRFIDTLKRFKEKCKYKIYAYCLMDNHIHLLIKEKEEPINVTMKRIGVSYVSYFNKRHRRIGHLFQDRYLSEAIEDDSYLLTVMRYIHNNPIKAKITAEPDEYKWSSYREYVHEEDIIEKDEILGMFSEDREKATEAFKEHGKKYSDNVVMDVEEGNSIEEILQKCEIKKEDIKHMEPGKRNEILRELKAGSGVSLRQIAEELGISKDIIFRA